MMDRRRMQQMASDRPQKIRRVRGINGLVVASLGVFLLIGGQGCYNLSLRAWHESDDSWYAARHLTVGHGANALYYRFRVNPSYVGDERDVRWYHRLVLSSTSSGTFTFGHPDDVWPAEFSPFTDSAEHNMFFPWDEHWDNQIPTGDYELSGVIYRDSFGRRDSFVVEGERDVFTRVVRQDLGFDLVPYYGDQRYGNSTETLGFERCYSLCVKARSWENPSQDNGVDGVKVSWSVKPGCNETIVSCDTLTDVFRFDSTEADGGLAECRVKLPPTCGYETWDTIIASTTGQPDVEFAVVRIPDNDKDDDPVLFGAPDSLHEWYPYTTQPYLGDGLWGTGDVGSPDGKDVILEVDYCWPDLGDNDGQARQRLDSALTKVHDIFYTTGGVNVYYVLDEALGLSDVPRGMADTTAARVLKEHRDFGGRGNASYQGYLHLIVGGTDDVASHAGGIVYFPVVHRGMYAGSTGLSPDGQNDELKKVGCYAFPVGFDSRLTWGQIGSGVGMTKEDYLALAIAHEVGHALGLAHPKDAEEDSSAMSFGLNPQREYSYYARFINPPPDRVSQHWQINTRKLLGRDGCEIRGNRWIYQQN
jgi:hypothetical protein